MTEKVVKVVNHSKVSITSGRPLVRLSVSLVIMSYFTKNNSRLKLVIGMWLFYMYKTH